MLVRVQPGLTLHETLGRLNADFDPDADLPELRLRAGSAQVGHDIGEGRHPRLSGGENERKGPTTVVGGEVDLGGESAAGPVDGVVVRLAVGTPSSTKRPSSDLRPRRPEAPWAPAVCW